MFAHLNLIPKSSLSGKFDFFKNIFMHLHILFGSTMSAFTFKLVTCRFICINLSGLNFPFPFIASEAAPQCDNTNLDRRYFSTVSSKYPKEILQIANT